MDEPGEQRTGGTRGPDGKYTRTPETAERDAEAARLRSRGLSYRAIADAMGWASGSVAFRAVRRALAAVVEEPAAEVRALELQRLDADLERLDTAEAAVMKVLEAEHVVIQHGRVVELNGSPVPDDAPVLQAVDRLVRINDARVRVSESRRKLLGLDAPVKAEIGGQLTYQVVGVPEDAL